MEMLAVLVLIVAALAASDAAAAAWGADTRDAMPDDHHR
jgi:hypothetical protein